MILISIQQETQNHSAIKYSPRIWSKSSKSRVGSTRPQPRRKAPSTSRPSEYNSAVKRSRSCHEAGGCRWIIFDDFDVIMFEWYWNDNLNDI